MQLARTRAIQALDRRIAVLLSAYVVSRDRLYGNIKKRKGRIEFMDFCRYVRIALPRRGPAALRAPTFSAHQGQQVRDRAHGNNVELASTPITRPGWRGNSVE